LIYLLKVKVKVDHKPGSV